MEILKKYKNFLNEASSDNITNIKDVPQEVINGAKKIILGIFDRVSRPRFEILPDKGLVYFFTVTPTDYRFIDYDEVLTLDKSQKRGVPYDISLTINDAVSETFEVSYIVDFKESRFNDIPEIDEDDDQVEDEPAHDDIDLEDDDDEFDEDVLDKKFKKKIKTTKDYYNPDYSVYDDAEDDDF